MHGFVSATDHLVLLGVMQERSCQLNTKRRIYYPYDKCRAHLCHILGLLMVIRPYCHGSSLDLTLGHVIVDIRHTCGRRYTGTLGRSHTGTFGRNHCHTRKEPSTVHASDFRLSIKPGISLSRILVLRSSPNITPDPILHPGNVIHTHICHPGHFISRLRHRIC
jgi:hypothetical protein